MPTPEAGMQDIQINQSMTNTILTFHANRLEYFYATSDQVGYSFHVGHIKAIQIVKEKNGKHTLVVEIAHRTNKDEVSDQTLSRVKELVPAVQETMKTIKF